MLIEDEFTKNTGLIISVAGHYLMKLFDKIKYLNTIIHITFVVNDVLFNVLYCKRIELGFKIKQNVAISKYIFQ